VLFSLLRLKLLGLLQLESLEPNEALVEDPTDDLVNGCVRRSTHHNLTLMTTHHRTEDHRYNTDDRMSLACSRWSLDQEDIILRHINDLLQHACLALIIMLMI